MHFKLVIITALTLTQVVVSDFDLTSCHDMNPFGDVAAQSSSPPYVLDAASNVYEKDVPIAITLKVDPMQPSATRTFEDFMLLAVCPTCTDPTVPVGSFTKYPSDVILLPCHNTKGGLTTAHQVKRNNLTVEWTPPSDFDKNVVIKASVVEKINVWWKNIESVRLSLKPKPMARPTLATDKPTNMAAPILTRRTDRPPTTATKCGSMSTAPTCVTLLMFVVAVVA